MLPRDLLMTEGKQRLQLFPLPASDSSICFHSSCFFNATNPKTKHIRLSVNIMRPLDVFTFPSKLLSMSTCCVSEVQTFPFSLFT